MPLKPGFSVNSRGLKKRNRTSAVQIPTFFTVCIHFFTCFRFRCSIKFKKQNSEKPHKYYIKQNEATPNRTAMVRIQGLLQLVPVTGLEPVRCCHRGILSPLRLPISPHRRVSIDFEYYTVIMGYCQGFSGNFCFIFKCF